MTYYSVVMPEDRSAYRLRKRWELVTVGLFVVANLAVPLLIEDFYPFTSTPMFRDRPRFYSNYRLYEPGAPADRPLPPERHGELFSALQLQRTYDGNPAGLGVGKMPLPTLDGFSQSLDGQFGQPDEADVREHVAERLLHLPDVERIDVEQQIFGPLENGTVGLVRSKRWTISRPESAQ